MSDPSRNVIRQNLSQRTAAGGVWMFGLRLAQQLITLTQLAFLGRLLSPDDFGLMGIASLATQAIAVFVYTGYEYALIQSPELSEKDVHTAWWIMLGRRLFIGAVLSLAAPLIARFYGIPEAIPLLRVMGLAQCVQGLASPAPSLLQRDLQYQKIFNYYVVSGLVGLVLGIVSAVILKNAWALMIATFSTIVANVVLSYSLCSYRPRWCFSRRSFHKFSSFGRWMLGSAILWFSFSQGANVFSGWMFGVTALGLYQMSSRFALFPSIQVGEIILGAVFPAYSLIQQDVDRISKAFLRVLNLSAVGIIGITVLIALGLPRLFVLVLGTQWTEASFLIPAVALAGGAGALLRTGSPLYLAVGRPRYQFLMDSVQTLVMLLLLYPSGRFFGIIGLPFAMLGGAISASPIWWVGIHKSTNCGIGDVYRALLPPLIGGAVMSAIFAIGQLPAFSRADNTLSVIWHLTLICLAIAAFALTILVMQRLLPGYAPVLEVKQMLKKTRQRIWPQVI